MNDSLWGRNYIRSFPPVISRGPMQNGDRLCVYAKGREQRRITVHKVGRRSMV